VSATELLVDGCLAVLDGSGGGGVNSVGVTSSDSSLTVSNSPITGSGNVGLALNTVGVAKGGTGLTSASEQGAMLYASSASAYVMQSVSPTFKNRIINGGMTIDQRNNGAAVSVTTAASQFTLDRWIGFVAGATQTFQQVAISTLSGFIDGLRVNGASGATDAAAIQRIESRNCYDLAGKSVTMSYWVFNSSASPLTITQATAYANAVDNFTAKTFFSTPTFSAPNGWTKITSTFTANANAVNGLEINIKFGAIAASQHVILTGVQLEAGSVATAFELRPEQVELALCQRYYWLNTGTQNTVAIGLGTTANNAIFYVKYPQTMRAQPTILASVRIEDVGTAYRTATTGTVFYGSDSAAMNFGSSSLVAGRCVILNTETNQTNFLSFNAEL
jgi:hypothetical protein